MKDNKDHIIDELLIRYLAGMATEDEQTEAEKWIGLSNENLLHFKKIKTIWESSSNLKAYQQIDTESSLKNVKGRIVFKSKKTAEIQILWMAARIAAILIVAFSIYLIFKTKNDVTQELKFTKIESGNGQKTVVLPDRTVVNLNRNSCLEYADNFNKSERRLKFDGEAYFEVKPDKSRPFIIETKRSETRVLGTAFNLKAYTGATIESIVVTHGRVEFSEKSKKAKQKLILEKGDKAVLAEHLNKEKNTDLNFMSWKTGIFIFNNEPLPKALELLSEYYLVEIKIMDNSIQSYAVSGKYEKKSLEQMLEILEMTLQLKSEKKNGQYWLKP